jgi:hypothetical protein
MSTAIWYPPELRHNVNGCLICGERKREIQKKRSLYTTHTQTHTQTHTHTHIHTHHIFKLLFCSPRPDTITQGKRERSTHLQYFRNQMRTHAQTRVCTIVGVNTLFVLVMLVGQALLSSGCVLQHALRTLRHAEATCCQLAIFFFVGL